MSTDSEWLAREIASLKDQVRALSTARQISRSTIPVADEAGQTVDMLVPDAVGLGVAAAGEARQAAEDAQAAVQAAEDALAEASLAKTTADGKNRVFASPTEPVPDEDAPFANGDLWYVLNGEGQVVAVSVFNGSSWVPMSMVADQVLVPGTVGSVLIEDGAITAPKMAALSITGEKLSADAIDGKTIRGAYVEAPIIASSPNLGTGENVLADPEFQGAIDESWIASGHLGDTTLPTKTETFSWDQTYTAQGPSGATTYRHIGNATVVTQLTPIARKVGSLLFTNSSWFKSAARTVSNPWTYPATSDWSGHPGGWTDPMWQKFMPDLVQDGTARTTYLTNANTFAINSGETWTLNLRFARLSFSIVQWVSAAVEVINASTGAVLWSASIPGDSLVRSSFNATFVAGFSATAKFRVKAVYQAAGGGFTSQISTGRVRKLNVTSGSTVTDVDVSGYYLRPASIPSTTWAPANAATDYRSNVELTLTGATLGKVFPEKGYRLATEKGLELFSATGAQTGRLDGVDNFLAGKFATAPSGERVEMGEIPWDNAQGLTWYDQSGEMVAVLRSYDVLGLLRLLSDTGWQPLPLAAGWGPYAGETPHYRVVYGIVYFTGRVSGTATAGITIGTLPLEARPGAAPFPPIYQGHSDNGTTILGVEPDGRVMIHSRAGQTRSGVSLASITFPAG